MGQCKNCKFFVAFKIPIEIGNCRNEKVFQYRNSYREGFLPGGVQYHDGDGFDHEPTVHEDFGCIHHQPKV